MAGHLTEPPAERRNGRSQSWKDTPRRWFGRLIVPCLPKSYVAKMIDDYYIDQEPKSFFRQAARDELTRRCYRCPEAKLRANNRHLFWGAAAGTRWHEDRRRRYRDQRLFHDEYLKSRGRMLEQLDWLLAHFPSVTNLCEIGTGNGLLVEYLARHLSQIVHFQGIDLSGAQISRNKMVYRDTKVEFLHVEVTEYVVRHCRPGTLLVACGTLECFTQLELEEFFALTKRTVHPVAIASCDAVDVDFDAAVEHDSRPRGNMLYNHNYRYLVEKHGYETCFYQLESPKPIYNRLSMLATSFPTRHINARNQISR
jgi:hypothetical protein